MVEAPADDALPAEIRTTWPVPWEPVLGSGAGLSDRLEHLAASAAIGFLTRVPSGVRAGLLVGLARIARRRDRRHSSAARTFLRAALGPMDDAELERRVLVAYRHFFDVLVETELFERHVPVERVMEHYEVSWSEEARRVADEGRGCILATAHLGHWEAVGAPLPWLGFGPVYAVAKALRNRFMSAVAQRRRERVGGRLLPRYGAMKSAPKVVRAGGCLIMLMDQRARRREVLAPFFGRPARCDRSAGVLMRRLGVPVLFGACFRTDEPLHYRLELGECLWPAELAHADPVEVATRVNGCLERMILRRPEQYHWLHDRFKDTQEAFPADRSAAAEPEPEAGGLSSDPTGQEAQRA